MGRPADRRPLTHVRPLYSERRARPRQSGGAASMSALPFPRHVVGGLPAHPELAGHGRDRLRPGPRAGGPGPTKSRPAVRSAARAAMEGAGKAGHCVPAAPDTAAPGQPGGPFEENNMKKLFAVAALALALAPAAAAAPALG